MTMSTSLKRKILKKASKDTVLSAENAFRYGGLGACPPSKFLNPEALKCHF